jgi:4-hydroxy-tetrahydrodipicolinate synthase
MKVYAGANHITTAGVVELARIAQDAGVDALSVLTPMFVSQTQEELKAYYTTVAASTDLPIVIYNNRPKTNVQVAPETVAALSQVPNIVGVKDSTGDMTNTEEYLRLTRDMPDFSVLVGRDTLILAGWLRRQRAITSCANIAPALAVHYRGIRRGTWRSADAQFRFSQLRLATNLGTFPVVIKEGLRMLGLTRGTALRPLRP